jgi:hypothetical protein
MPEVHCKHRLPGPEVAGAVDWVTLKNMAAEYPHLRPCPRHKDGNGGWNWIYRKYCRKCPDAAREGV